MTDLTKKPSEDFTIPSGLPVLAYDVKDFCLACGVGKTKVYEAIKEGKLRAGNLWGKTIIPIEEARRVIAEAVEANQPR